MKNKKVTLFNKNVSLGAMWFGASISIAELLTGTYAASLGAVNGFLAIFVGHILGCALLFAMAFLGAKTGLNSMRVTKLGFGHLGACIFAGLNAIQLFGWASVMIYNGGLAVSGEDGNFLLFIIPAVVITSLLIIWLIFIKRDSFILNTLTVVALGLVCLILTIIIILSSNSVIVANDYTFSQVIEFSTTMPISWLPVIADYTAKLKNAEQKAWKTGLVASASYLVGGCWMYFIGMFSMLKFGADDIYLIMKILPIGGVAIFVVITSTVVNTFIDGQSTGESISAFSKTKKIDKHITSIGIAVFVVGLAVAVLMKENNSFTELYQIFLGYIAAVFGPMAAVLAVRVILFKVDSSNRNWDLVSFINWLIGFVAYEVMVSFGIETIIGITLPVVVLTVVLTVISSVLVNRFFQKLISSVAAFLTS